MAGRSDDAGSSTSQRAANAGSKPVETSNPNIGNENHAVGHEEEAIIKSALENQGFNRIDKIFKANPGLVYNASRITNDYGDTLLHAAVDQRVVNSHRVVQTRRALLAGGADLGAQNNDQNTPFHLISSYLTSIHDDSGMALTVLQELLGLSKEAPHHEQTRSSLISALDKRNNTGDTVLHLIASSTFDKDSRSKSLEQTQAKQAVKDILSVYHTGLVSIDSDGNTPLHRACKVGNAVIVETLLQEDRRLESEAHHIAHIKNGAGDIPLHLAVRNGPSEAVKKLMTADQSVGTLLVRNDRKETPVHTAVRERKLGILCQLLQGRTYEELVLADNEYGLRDENGMTPLHIAAENTKVPSMMPRLLEGCTDPSHLNEAEPKNGWTALHFLASRGSLGLVMRLLEKGADSKKTDKHNLLAADIASRANHVDVGDFIRQHRPRTFRLELKPGDDNTAKVDDQFLVLSWPTWDKLKDSNSRMWSRLTPVHQFIFNATDRRLTNKSRGLERGLELDLSVVMHPGCRQCEMMDESHGIPGEPIVLDAIFLQPIHQAQICFSSPEAKLWDMRERRDFNPTTHGLVGLKGPNREINKDAKCTYVYDAKMFQGKLHKRSTWWIHFPANNVGIKMTTTAGHFIRVLTYSTSRELGLRCVLQNGPRVLSHWMATSN